MKKLSILIPAYNVENYIEECINSILNLNIDYEIIIINDGSTDKTLKKIQKYKKYNYIKIISQENMGISKTRNNLLKSATGKYIFFLDADDYINKENFIKLLNNLDNQDLILFNYNIYNNNTKKFKKNIFKSEFNLIKNNKEKFIELICKRNDLYLWTFLIKKEIITKKQIDFLPYLFEDLEFLLKIIYHTNTIEFIDLNIVNYRINRDNQITKIHSYENISHRIIMSDIVIKQVQTYNLTKNIKEKLYSRIANIFYSAIPLIKTKNKEEQELLMDLIDNYSYILKYASIKTIILKILMKINKNFTYNSSNYFLKLFKLY